MSKFSRTKAKKGSRIIEGTVFWTFSSRFDNNRKPVHKKTPDRVYRVFLEEIKLQYFIGICCKNSSTNGITSSIRILIL